MRLLNPEEVNKEVLINENFNQADIRLLELERKVENLQAELAELKKEKKQ